MGVSHTNWPTHLYHDTCTSALEVLSQAHFLLSGTWRAKRTAGSFGHAFFSSAGNEDRMVLATSYSQTASFAGVKLGSTSFKCPKLPCRSQDSMR